MIVFFQTSLGSSFASSIAGPRSISSSTASSRSSRRARLAKEVIRRNRVIEDREHFRTALFRRRLWKATPAITVRRTAAIEAGLFDETSSTSSGLRFSRSGFEIRELRFDRRGPLGQILGCKSDFSAGQYDRCQISNLSAVILNISAEPLIGRGLPMPFDCPPGDGSSAVILTASGGTFRCSRVPLGHVKLSRLAVGRPCGRDHC